MEPEQPGVAFFCMQPEPELTQVGRSRLRETAIRSRLKKWRLRNTGSMVDEGNYSARRVVNFISYRRYLTGSVVGEGSNEERKEPDPCCQES